MAAKLTKDQILFLEKHGIALDQVFDASGMRRAEYKAAMKERGYLIAIGVNPCRAGHTMKTRAFSCPECDPARLEYLRRYRQPGYVYFARSSSTGLKKIGISKSPKSRIAQSNVHGLGMVSDWKILRADYCKEAGVVEQKILSVMRDYLVNIDYGGRAERSREILDCKQWELLEVYMAAIDQPTEDTK